MLDAASRLVKPGGQLVYSTCSLEVAENEDNVNAFLERHGEFELSEMHTLEPVSRVNDGGFRALLVRRK